MIGRVYRGRDTAGLLDYLYRPGRRNEHVDPHLVASWDGAPGALEPPASPGRPGRYEVGRLARLLDAPLRLRERPPDRHVWHCALRVAKTDRRLTDAEWRAVAEDVVARTGYAPRGDDGGCRWVAVRHADDHIHLVVVLARQDGRAVRGYRDYVRLRAACRAAEARYGLVSTAPADRTATPATSGREADKATRLGRVASREVLRGAARAAAVEVGDPEAFLARLRAMGRIQVKERRGQAGELTGYALAVTGDRDAAGKPVWYSGGKLAADLTLPKLVARWATVAAQAVADEQATTGAAPAGPQRLVVLADAAGAARRATSALASGQAAADGVAHATADLLTAAARVAEGRRGGPVTAAADRYDRAARAPWTPVPRLDAVGRDLRLMAWHLAALRMLGGRRERDAAAELLSAAAALTVAIATYHLAQARAAQAEAALQAARVLHGVVDGAVTPTAASSPRWTPTVPAAPTRPPPERPGPAPGPRRPR
jgi:hypothetical protein